MSRNFVLKLILGFGVALLSGSLAHATAFTFNVNGTGSCAGGTSVSSIGTMGNPVNAQAVITTNNGSITVKLTNCTTGENTVAQNISDVFFTVAGATSGTVGNASASYINIASDGTITSGSAAGQWGLCFSGGAFHLDALGCNATGTPSDTIVGTADCSHQNSICGNDPHNPFINGTATWTITAAGVTTASSVTNVVISFGTQDFANSGGTPTPEPGTLLLLGSGLLGVAGIVRKRLVS